MKRSQKVAENEENGETRSQRRKFLKEKEEKVLEEKEEKAK